ncbi:PREDICTED: uncharacterized protein LOC109475670 [Branchiostoma belcheri]|uniref:Uncharacterized protein LOC109475670 n=1 Tax=Branchiostoma belcheri TaxID=7741 RepID=A0A6P4ZDN9_BRABE|nr:PREDICTED: uncharacterized protein LOC109475670 [Branchiostoma belcheri]
MWTLVASVVVACFVLSKCVSSQTLCQSLTADSGSFSSQNYPNNYPNDHDCRYEISVSSPKVIKLTFTDFEVENDFDHVYVYDGNTTDSNYLLAELNGAKIPGPVTSTGSFMTVRLVTDSEVNWKGFQASYAAEDKVLAKCGVGEYRCANGVTCINAWKRCDGNSDCTDNSDEDATNCVCELIPSSLTRCRGLHYRRMTLPNPLNFDHTKVTQVENSAGFNELMALADLDCHPRVRDLVCATIVPRCKSRPTHRQLLPCRSWCEEVKSSCEHENAWSAFPSCEIFPHTNCNNIVASKTPENEECFDGNGANYRGDEARGPVAGVDCERWDSDPRYIQLYPWANLVDNKCRNPENDTRPWCITPGGFEYCDIIPCNDGSSFSTWALLMGDLTKKLKDEETTKYTIRKNATDIEGYNNAAMKTDGHGSPSGGDPIIIIRPGMQNEVAATLGGLKESVDDLKVSVSQLSGSIDGLAKASGGDDEEEVGEYALLASVLDRLSLVIYVIAIVVAVPCTLLIGRPHIIPE